MNDSDQSPSKLQIVNCLKIIEGQIHGLQEMIYKDFYCMDVMQQTTSIKQALSKIEDIMMENHLNTCSILEIKNGDAARAVDEIIKVYRLKRK